VELTHLATLYHDDVMDEAALRRGAVSANARWDNTVAILTGDFLFARASDILADLGPDAVRLQARTFERLVTGQIRETVGPNAGDSRSWPTRPGR
jgi:heptaprenyl diphosphate synthase